MLFKSFSWNHSVNIPPCKENREILGKFIAMSMPNKNIHQIYRYLPWLAHKFYDLLTEKVTNLYPDLGGVADPTFQCPAIQIWDYKIGFSIADF